MKNTLTIWLSAGLMICASLAEAVTINDVTQLNPIEVERVETPRSIEEVQKLVKEHQGAISIGGGRFSMGGQIGSEKTLHLDMRQMNRILAFDAQNKTITVEPGITWRKIQEHIDPKNLSVKIMQSYASFSVGGSLSVNVHGRYVGLGPLASSVRTLKIVLADGTLKEASPTQNSDIFWGAIGGYGALGVIVEASLDLTDNVAVERVVKKMKIEDYVEHFKKDIRDDKKAIFHNGDIYPPQYQNVVSITWAQTDKPVTVPDRLMPIKPNSWIGRAQLFGVSEIPFGKELRAKVLDPMTLRKSAIVWRNYEASYDVTSLEPSSRTKTTYVLQEYFVPVEKFGEFAPKMASIFKKHKANILNVSIRHAHKDPGSIMAWSREETFAFVVYYKQGTSTKAQEDVGKWTRELIDAVLAVNGTYYLPYQLHATQEQFDKAYPRAKELFALKKKYDPAYKFRNKLLDKYNPPPRAPAAETKKRDEAQTFLTLPEWYVVFSADEYAAHIAQNDPADFPYFQSIAQFWRLYRAVLKEVKGKYPFNWEYNIMIAVVGVSFTGEYAIKGVYENTIGRLTSALSGGDSAQERYMAAVAQEYANFIHHVPWYEFPYKERFNTLFDLQPNTNAGSLRRWERSFSAGAELLSKALYAWIIKQATGASFEAQDLEIEVLADGKGRVTFPRYEKFTDELPRAIKQGMTLQEIAGNRMIVVTLIAPRAWEGLGDRGRKVIEWPILTQPEHKRVAVAAEVTKLDELVLGAEAEGYRLDHIYDY